MLALGLCFFFPEELLCAGCFLAELSSDPVAGFES